MITRFIILLFGLMSLVFVISCNGDDNPLVSEEGENNDPPNPPNPPDPENSTSLELFYYSKRNGANNIYKSDLEGNESPVVIDDGHHDWWIRVSPDRQTILWYKSPLNVAENEEFNNYDEAELWMANADGSSPRKVIDLSDYGWEAQGVADWSPDGNELVMAARTQNHWGIYITDKNGENPDKISQGNTVDYADPSWSPDGQKIVFAKFVGLNLEIHIMDKDGSNEIQLTDDDGYQNYDPYWSPDGREIAFESKWSILDCFLLGKWAIRKYNFDTQLTTDVIKDDNINGLARWTDDSEEIYFSLSVCGEYGRIARMDRNGENLEVILEDNSFPYYDCDVVESDSE